MTQEKFFGYRGQIKAVLGLGSSVGFVTHHPENQATALYRIDLEKLALSEQPLPQGGMALVQDEANLYIAGSDSQLYVTPLTETARAPKPLGPALPARPARLAILSGDRLGVLCGESLLIVSRKDGTVSQTLPLPELGTALGSDPIGNWIAVGTKAGNVLVFEAEQQSTFEAGGTAKIHEGEVTALLFEPDEHRFLSAGMDQKLFSTHARGKLEPEDRGRGSSHEDRLSAMLWANEERFITGGFDRTLKTWVRGGGTKPATLKDNTNKVVDLALVSIHGKTHIVAGCTDHTLRVYFLDAVGKFGGCTHLFRDALASIKHDFESNEASRREKALKELAALNDSTATDLLGKRTTEDNDPGLQLLAAQLLADSPHPRAAPLLEAALKHASEAVRLAAFHGLRKKLGETEFRPLDLALETGKANIGVAAVTALTPLAKTDEHALQRLVKVLNNQPLEVRQAALEALETIYDAKSPLADLQGLQSSHADLRRLALIRLYQRQFLDNSQALGAIRRSMEDKDADVRQTAFLVSLFSRPELATALRSLDPNIHRQLHELEIWGQDKTDKKLPTAPKKKPALAPADYEPLLQAMASRSLDVCLQGARSLALLGDPRAFGLLLQLSQEPKSQARVEVCQAFGFLGDPRSLKRLRTMLHDPEADVRDAAFTALAGIIGKQPLQAAEAGLNASHEDVRKRGLQLLIQELKKKKPTKPEEETWQLLLRALNDSFESIRNEAFKATLNLEIGGGGGDTLRVALQSVHEQVRREVLTEVMARIKEDWAQPLLFDIFSDPSAKVRKEALDFALSRRKKNELEPLAAALASRHADIRLMAVETLKELRTAEAQKLLTGAIHDDNRDVRQKALTALITADAQDALRQALQSQHVDVRLKAAQARARYGDEAAMQPLLELVRTPEPPPSAAAEEVNFWKQNVQEALAGLGELGLSAAAPELVKQLDSKHPPIRQAAAKALVWSADQPELLREALRHQDAAVKYQAALGLAYRGDQSALSLVFSDQGSSLIDDDNRMAAALVLGETGTDHLLRFLNHSEALQRQLALFILLSSDLLQHDGTPAGCLAALASQQSRIRLQAALALEQFNHPQEFFTRLREVIEEASTTKAEKNPLTDEQIRQMAVLLLFAPPLTQARTLLLLGLLDSCTVEEFIPLWELHIARHAKDLTAAQKAADKQKLPKSQYEDEELRQIAFGTYVGLVRDQSGAQHQGSPAMRVRQTALKRLLTMAQANAAFAESARPVLIQALSDPNAEVRTQAFEQLETLKVDAAEIAAAAIESGFRDTGIAGFKLLTTGVSAKAGQKILEEAMLSRTDDLAYEAAVLLAQRTDEVTVAAKGLDAASARMRQVSVQWLAQHYDKGTQARDLLRSALQSRYRQIRLEAAQALATKKDTAAFEALIELLRTEEQSWQRGLLVNWLVELGDKRTPAALLELLAADKAGKLEPDAVLWGVGSFRDAGVVPRLLDLLEDKKLRQHAMNALVTISGFDQAIEDLDDEREDKSWETKQYPRNSGVLAKILLRLHELNLPDVMVPAVFHARWSRGSDVDPMLATLAHHPEDRLRNQVVEAIGWRLRKRNGSAKPLEQALQHKQDVTRFLAAEGLALAGKNTGINILLAAVDLLDDITLRQRAVVALGKLADARALDLLLKLASEDGHALQEGAAEAIGHLSQSEKADEIFDILQRYAKGNAGLARSAMYGLRWFDTPDAWKLIREKAREENLWWRHEIFHMLSYNDQPETRELYLHTLRTTNQGGWFLEDVLQHSRRLFGVDSLEPDYAILQRTDNLIPQYEDVLKRVTKRGTADRLLEVVARMTHPDARVQLMTAVLQAPELPVEKALQLLGDSHPRAVEVAAHILGRATKPPKNAAKQVQSSLESWRAKWEECYADLRRRNQSESATLQQYTETLRWLTWAAGKLEADAKTLLPLAQAHPDLPAYRPIRQAALEALAAHGSQKEVQAAFQAVATGEDALLRPLAASLLLAADPKRAGEVSGEILRQDNTAFSRLADSPRAKTQPALEAAATELHYQGIALPHLINSLAVDELAAIARNGKLPDLTRLGAIEALARCATTEGEQYLVSIGTNESEDEELRKAAWRARRRSIRQRQHETEKV